MKIQDLLETVDDDNNLIRASRQIYNALIRYALRYGDSPINSEVYLGKVEDLIDFSFPPIGGIQIYIDTQDAINNHFGNKIPDNEGTTSAYYNFGTYSIVFNADKIVEHNKFIIQTTITHELRHALDAMSMKYTPTSRGKYFTPKKKEHRLGASTNYIAQPIEINARFSELLHLLSEHIPPKNEIEDKPKFRDKLLRFANRLFDVYQIAELFPEKTNSKDYKRLLNRAYKFVENNVF